MKIDKIESLYGDYPDQTQFISLKDALEHCVMKCGSFSHHVYQSKVTIKKVFNDWFWYKHNREPTPTPGLTPTNISEILEPEFNSVVNNTPTFFPTKQLKFDTQSSYRPQTMIDMTIGKISSSMTSSTWEEFIKHAFQVLIFNTDQYK